MMAVVDSVDTIRTRQIAALKQLINLNQPVSSSSAVEPVWKVLVLDRYGQDIVSPLIPVKQLRDLGVTLHLYPFPPPPSPLSRLIESDREALPDVPAVYFISPSSECMRILCDDVRNALYQGFYINCIGALPRTRLEEIAEAAVKGSTVQFVHKLTDQYLNFISLEDDLFVLRRYSEKMINDPSTSTEEMDAMLNGIVESLFSVCATLGVVPIIRSPRHNAAEHVAERLDKKLRENLRDARNNLFVGEGVRGQLGALQRPLLLIADRAHDLATMLHHTWSYQALIHDVLDLDLNRVVMRETSGKRKEYDMLAGSGDKLWTKHKGSAFPQLAEAVQEELDDYRSCEAEVKRLKQAMGVGEVEMDDAMLGLTLSDRTSQLSTTMGRLPELLERKRLIDVHTNIATAVLEQIKTRKLDLLFEAEEKLLNRQPVDVLHLIEQCQAETDRLRLVLINFLCSPSMSTAELNDQVEKLKETGIDVSAIHFVQRLRSVSNLSVQRDGEEQSGAGTRTVNMFSKLLSHSSRFVMEGVKNLVPKKHNLPLTNLVDLLIDPSQSPSNEVDAFRYFDPKLVRSTANASSNDSSQRGRSSMPPQDVIIFVIGGGNYVEYQNLIDYGTSKGLARITYGCTELVSPRQFTDQLTRLGRQLSS